MKISTATVRRTAGAAAALSHRSFGLAFTAKPGHIERYVDRATGRTFAGPGASRRAAAFYAGVTAELTTGDPNPAITAILAETTERHAADITAGRDAARQWQHQHRGHSPWRIIRDATLLLLPS